MALLSLQELWSCSGEGAILWVEGHVDRRAFIGAVLSSTLMMDYDLTGRDLFGPRVRFRQGWWGTFEEGQDESCEAGYVERAIPGPDAPGPMEGTVRAVTWIEIDEARMGAE